MKKFLLILIIALGIIIIFTGTASAEVIFELSVDYSGRTNNIAPHYLSGPTLDFVIFPPLYATKDAMEFVFGFGFTSGALFGFRNGSGVNYDAIIPIQLNFNMDTIMHKVSKSLHLGGQFRMGFAIGINPTETQTGFIMSAGAIGKFMFTENIGMKLSPEFGFLIIDDVMSPSFSFSVGFVIRFYAGKRKPQNNENKNENEQNDNDDNDDDDGKNNENNNDSENNEDNNNDINSINLNDDDENNENEDNNEDNDDNDNDVVTVNLNDNN
jgi:hypothetical protein